MEDSNVFALTTLASITGKIIDNSWISLVLRKDISADSFKYTYFSITPFKTLLKNVARVDAFISTFTSESKQLAEVTLGLGQ